MPLPDIFLRKVFYMFYVDLICIHRFFEVIDDE